MALRRARIGLAGLLMTLLAVFAWRIFDQATPELLVASTLPVVAALVLCGRGAVVRLVAMVVIVPASVAIVVALAGGDTTDFQSSFTAGFARLLSTDWPSPTTPDLLGFAALVLAGSSAIATDTAGSSRFHLAPLLPACVVGVAIVGASAPRTTGVGWLVGVAALSMALAALRVSHDRTSTAEPTPISIDPEVLSADAMATEEAEAADAPPAGGGLADRVAVLRGERRVVPIIVLGALVAGAVSLPIGFNRRADPRTADPADRSAALFDPIESTLGLRAIDPPIDLHAVDGLGTVAVPTRWRTAALDTFTGARWAPSITLRPIGRRLGPDASGTVSFDLTMLDPSITLLPLPGRPVSIDGSPIETDDQRTVVRLVDRDLAGPLSVVAATSPVSLTTATAEGATQIVSRPVDDAVSGLSEFASSLAGEGTLAEQLQRIETTMRDEFVLASNAPGAGQQQALIERFVRETRRGTAEQFATGFVLLARSLGVDARVATGFIVDAGGSTGAGRLTITSADAAVWPEIHLSSGDWVPLDPVPESETSDVTPPVEDQAVQTPAAAQPPIAPPPDPGDETAAEDTSATDPAENATAAITRFVRRFGVIGGIFVLPILLLVLVIIGAKYRRRRRRLRAATAAERVRGAWSLATDHLVDAGLDIASSDTNGEIARAGADLAGASRHDLRHLASLSNVVTFGTPTAPDAMADDAHGYLRSLERTMAAERTVRERARWRLSSRSLRRRTRSPVRS